MAHYQPLPPPHPDAATQSSLREIWGTVRRHRWMMMGTTLVTVALVGVYTLVARPRYDSISTLRIESADAKTAMLSRLIPDEAKGLPSLGSDEVDTELAVLRSHRIAQEVAEEVGLHVHLASPRRERGAVLEVVRAPADAGKGDFSLQRQEDGSYAVAQVDGSPVPVPPRVRIGEPFQVGKVVLTLVPTLRQEPPERIRFRVASFRETVDGLRDDLRAKRDGNTKLIKISYRSTDPVLSAAVVNGVAESFIRYKLGTTRTDSRSTVEVLRGQIAASAEDLRTAEERLQQFQESERVIAPAQQVDHQVRRLADLELRRDQMQVERTSLGTLLAQVEASARASSDVSPYRRLATFPSFIHNRAIQDILAHLTNLEGQRSLLLQRRTEVDPDVRQLTDRITDLEEQMHLLASSYLTSLDNQIASAGTVSSGFQGEIARLPGREAEYMRLARDQRMLAEVYVHLQTRLKEAELKDAIDRGIVRQVDTGLVAEERDAPKPVVNLVLAALLGMMLGFTIAFGRDLMDTTVRSPADAEQAAHGLAVLGAIPRIESGRASLRNGRGRWIALPGRKVIAAPDEAPGPRLVTRFDPRAPASEAYRALRTSITFAGEERPLRVLVMTSALPGEGKSTNAANLAMALAQQGTRVLLVDADLRRGALDGVLGARRGPGLAHVLSGTASLEQAVQVVDAGDSGAPLHFLSTGDYPSNPAEVLGSPRMRELMAELRAKFEMVIFDAPPMNLVTDAAVLGTLADSTVLVARNGITGRSALEHAVTQLRNLRVPVGGVVLNDFSDPERSGYALSYGPVGWNGD